MKKRARGQLIKRGKDTYLIRISLGRDPVTSQRKYANFTFHGNKKEAEAFLTKKLGESDTGVVVIPSRKLLGAWMDEWLSTIASVAVSPRTLEDYTWITNNYIKPTLGGLTLKQLDRARVQRFVSELFGRDPRAARSDDADVEVPGSSNLSPRTVRYAYSILHNALNEAVEQGLIGANPAAGVKLPKKVRYQAQPLDEIQVKAFLAAAAGTRWFALWLLMLTAGVRPGEALALQWKDVDFTTCTLNIRRALARLKNGQWFFKEPKSSKGRRMINVPRQTIEVLQRLRDAQAGERRNAGDAYQNYDLVLANQTGGPLDYRVVVRRYFKPLLKRGGLPPIRPYDLRHTHATLLLLAGVNAKVISERLGHASVAFTLETYTHVIPSMHQDTVIKIEALLFEGGS